MLVTVLVSIFLIIVAYCVITMTFYRELPQLHDRDEYKVWKAVYNDDGERTCSEHNLRFGKLKRWTFSNFPDWYALEYPDETVAVFNKYGGIAFSPYWRKHSHKLYLKLNTIKAENE